MKMLRGDPARHFFMTRSVARVMGLNLSEEIRLGRLNPDSYVDMVTRCQDCALVEACQEWLSRQTSLSATPPPGCCNSVRLSELRKRH